MCVLDPATAAQSLNQLASGVLLMAILLVLLTFLLLMIAVPLLLLPRRTYRW